MTFNRQPLGLKADKPTRGAIAAGKRHMRRVAQLPCICCGRPGPNEVHHVISGRFGQRRSSDFETIPLCPAHHRLGPLAIHSSKRAWESEWGMDFDYLPLVADMLAGEISE